MGGQGGGIQGGTIRLRTFFKKSYGNVHCSSTYTQNKAAMVLCTNGVTKPLLDTRAQQVTSIWNRLPLLEY